MKVPAAAESGSQVDRLVVPYTLDTNDMKYASPAGFPSGDQFSPTYVTPSTFSTPKGRRAHPRCCRSACTAGRPAGTAALERFLDHVQSHDRVWITCRIDIARHWIDTHPPIGAADLPGA